MFEMLVIFFLFASLDGFANLCSCPCLDDRLSFHTTGQHRYDRGKFDGVVVNPSDYVAPVASLHTFCGDWILFSPQVSINKLSHPCDPVAMHERLMLSNSS
ncbi:unnamed protein product [Ectocarpus sp. 4 AP-2014]